MTETVADQRPNQLPDIDSLLAPTHDEHARVRAIGSLHAHAMLNLRFQVRETLEKTVAPAFEKKHGRPPTESREIINALGSDHFFKFYSSIRYNAQEMGPIAKQPVVERSLPQMIEVAKAYAATNPAGGTLELDPNLELPRYYTDLDTHLAPGSFYSEYVEDDVAQGVLLGWGLSTIQGKSRLVKQRNFSGIGDSIAYWIKQTYPDFQPRRVLDMGTQSGANLMAYPRAFPGCEGYGVDLAAPALRYGHAKAGHAGVPLHFSQQNAEKTNFEDGYFDLIVSSFFLHELPVKTTRKVLAEAYRLLAPGGILAFEELPPHKACDAFLNSAFDWDTRYNNEPYYTAYRSQDPTEMVVEAGFPRETAFELTVPDVTSFDLEVDYPRFLRGELEAPLHGRGGWFIFGARKT